MERARLTWIEETVSDRPLGDVEHLRSLIAAAERAGAAGDHDLHVDLLWLFASRAWWRDPGPDARNILIDASRRLGGIDAEDPRIVAVHAYADPLGHATGVLARLRREAQDERIDADAARFSARSRSPSALLTSPPIS